MGPTSAMDVDACNKIRQDNAKAYRMDIENQVEKYSVLTDLDSSSEQLCKAWRECRSAKEKAHTLSMMCVNFEHLDNLKMTATTRTLCLSRVSTSYTKEGGCNCEEHFGLFRHATEMNKKLYDEIPVFQKKMKLK